MPVKKLDLNLLPMLESVEVQAQRKVIARALEGNWRALLKGQGMEFAGFRKYQYGDDALRIDWAASLRAKDTLVREYEEFKNLHILFMLDISNTMLFSSQKKLKAEYAAEMVFVLSVAILDCGESVGYVMFNDRVIAQNMPSIGKQAIFRMAQALSNPKNYGGEKDLRAVVNAVSVMLKQKALIIMVSDFIGMPLGWEQYIRILGEKFDLIGIMIRDPRDRQFAGTGGQYLLQDPFSDERLYVDVKDYKQLFEEAVREEEQYVRGVFEAAKASFIFVGTDMPDLYAPILLNFRRRAAIMKG